MIVLWGCFVAIVAGLTIATIGLSRALADARRESERTVFLALETAERAQKIFDNTQKTIRDLDNAEARRDRFLMFGSKIIEEYYLKNGVPISKRFSPRDQTVFLREIWARYETGEYIGADPFLCLSYAMVESDFSPVAIGKAGERGPFQFMRSTSEDCFNKFFNEPYYYGIEENPAVAVRLWYTYHSWLYNNVHGGAMGKSTDDVQWVAIAYNVGAWTRGLEQYVRELKTPDEYINETRVLGRDRYHYDEMIKRNYNSMKAEWERAGG
jgi:hypothetical protein